MPKQVRVLVKQDGTTNTDYLHFEGAACLEANKRLHELLAQFGVQVEQLHLTPKPELLAALEQADDVTLEQLGKAETHD